MNRVIEVHGGRRLIIPVGLPELMNDIGKEVIKHQPENLLEFIAIYLEKRVQQLRRRDPLKKDLSAYSEIEQSLPRETRMILDDCGIDLYTAEKAATTIQATFRGFQTRKRLKEEKRERETDNNVETLSENQDEGMGAVNKVRVERSNTTIGGSSINTIPEVDFKTSKPSIDLTSTYEQVSVDHDGEYTFIGTNYGQERPSFTYSMISTNTITKDMTQESNTYLDLTEVYRKSLDPFKEVEKTETPTVITSDLEIFKHIDLEDYEDTIKAYEHIVSNDGQKEGGDLSDEVSGSQQTNESTQVSSLENKSISPRMSGSIRRSQVKGDDLKEGSSRDELLKSPRKSGSTRRSQDKGDDLKEGSSQDEVLKSPRLSSDSQTKDDGDKIFESSGKVDSNENTTLKLEETEDRTEVRYH
ncbi:hypothetical protein LSTR_LSTR005534 [Laodelphax striatellus]|uniref:RIIa domain-containing protein n=1 Tax=Laodelphax striatellus TaxID=195883 RepID=A0A482WXF8_LAOST|nr:hypothetical protein LSTR_LSTR005534 [Laodelphax striatellus]